MRLADVLLLLLAAICFGVAALGWTHPRIDTIRLIALGLLFWVIVPLIDAVNALGG